jgi:hypothetical protein
MQVPLCLDLPGKGDSSADASAGKMHIMTPYEIVEIDFKRTYTLDKLDKSDSQSRDPASACPFSMAFTK